MLTGKSMIRKHWYKELNFWKQCIRVTEKKTYYCTQCKSNHRHGKIWMNHKKYKFVEKPITPQNKLITIDPLNLRSIALRQIGQLFYRMGLGNRKTVYIDAINKLLTTETGGLDSRN